MENTIPGLIHHMIINCQRTVKYRYHAKNLQSVSNSYGAACNGNSLRQLQNAQTLSGSKIDHCRFVQIK